MYTGSSCGTRAKELLAGADVVGGADDEAGGAADEIANAEGRAATLTCTGGRRIDDDEEACAASLFTGVRSIKCESAAMAEL